MDFKYDVIVIGAGHAGCEAAAAAAQMANKYPFWYPMISIVPHHSGDDFHFNSFPVIQSAVFNKSHDRVKLRVMQSFNSGSFYYLSKRSGKWEVVRCRDGWVM